MIKAAKTILIPLLIILLNSGFTIYKPGVVYSPLLSNKYDLNISASLGALGSGYMNAQVAYALSSHMGLMLNGMFHDYDQLTTISYQGVKTSNVTETIRINSVDAGVGYFNRYGARSNKLFQLYGGLGAGAASDISLSGLKYEGYSNFNNVFMQIGWAHIGRFFESAFDLRAKYVHMYNIRANIPSYSDLARHLPAFTDNSKSDFINYEPVYTLRAGFGDFKGTFQFGLVITRVFNDYYAPTYTAPSIDMLDVFKISIGFSYTFKQ